MFFTACWIVSGYNWHTYTEYAVLCRFADHVPCSNKIHFFLCLHCNVINSTLSITDFVMFGRYKFQLFKLIISIFAVCYVMFLLLLHLKWLIDFNVMNFLKFIGMLAKFASQPKASFSPCTCPLLKAVIYLND